MREKWVGFSRRAWGYALTVGGTIGFALTYATPTAVEWAMQPFLMFTSAFGWEPAPELTERAIRATMGLAGMVGVFSALRSRVHPDDAKLTKMPGNPVEAILGSKGPLG